MTKKDGADTRSASSSDGRPGQPPSLNVPPTGLPGRYLVVTVLALVYLLNFVDRQLLSVLAEPVKADLGLSDTQLGLLTGLTFALFYSVFGIPLAALADRGNRVRLIALACAVWSGFTALSGFATNFLTLALARVGVGIGEAGCSPPAYSILADYFPPKRRGRALAIYMLGVPAGSFAGVTAGAWIGAEYGWRTAFVVIGLLGLVAAPLVLLFIREPVRGASDPVSVSPPSDQAGVSDFRSGLGFVLASPVLRLSALASGLTAFVSYGIMNWAPSFLGRVQGMALTEISAFYGVAIGACMVLSAWFGGVIADRYGSRNPVHYALLPALAVLASIPFLLAFATVSDWRLSMLALLGPLILTNVFLIPAIALLQNRTPPGFRAMASALLLFVINLVGLGGGPLFVGMISDALEARYGVQSLAIALRWLAPVAVAAALCHGATAWLLSRETPVRA